MRNKKEVICLKCNGKFIAVRNDARTCKKCNYERIKKWTKIPEVRNRRLERYKLLRKFVIDSYGGKCNCCGENKVEFLAVDHINGGGNMDRKENSIEQILKRIIKLNFPTSYRVLCHNCNLSLGFYGYCPHLQRTA